jgi:hypothetical protein
MPPADRLASPWRLGPWPQGPGLQSSARKARNPLVRPGTAKLSRWQTANERRLTVSSHRCRRPRGTTFAFLLGQRSGANGFSCRPFVALSVPADWRSVAADAEPSARARCFLRMTNLGASRYNQGVGSCGLPLVDVLRDRNGRTNFFAEHQDDRMHRVRPAVAGVVRAMEGLPDRRRPTRSSRLLSGLRVAGVRLTSGARVCRPPTYPGTIAGISGQSPCLPDSRE